MAIKKAPHAHLVHKPKPKEEPVKLRISAPFPEEKPKPAAPKAPQEEAPPPAPAPEKSVINPIIDGVFGIGPLAPEKWGFEVINIDHLRSLSRYWILDVQTIQAEVDRDKGETNIPGIRVFRR